MADGNNAGGLTGAGPGIATASYWSQDSTGQDDSAAGIGKLSSELRSPTSNTGIYRTWDARKWDFGTDDQYPVLKNIVVSVWQQR